MHYRRHTQARGKANVNDDLGSGSTRPQTPSTSHVPSGGPAAEHAGWLSWTAAIGIVLLVVVRSPTENMAIWTPKVAVALVLTGLAIPQFVVLLRRPGPLRLTAVAGGVFLVVVALASLLSPLTGIAFLGQYGVSSGVGWVFYLCLVAFWSLGATLDSRGPRLIHDAVVVACVLDSAASVLGLFTEHQSAFADALSHLPGIYTGSGQSLGLMDNPVFSGALLAGGAVLLATTTRFSERIRYELLIVVAIGLELSGSRFGLLVVAGALVGIAAVKGVRQAWRPTLPAVAGIAIGYVLNHFLGGSDVSSRIAAASSETYSGRLIEWFDALRVASHHPFLGVGPGQATTAISPLWTSSFARSSGPFGDSHDLFIEILVTTGFIGLASFVLWFVPVLRHAHGPLVACGIAMLSVELVEPLYVGVTPIAFLVLGAAIRRPGRSTKGPPADVEVPSEASATPPTTRLSTGSLPPDPGFHASRALRVVTTGIAVIAAGLLLVGDAYFHQGLTASTNQAAALRTAIRLLPPWPDMPSDLSSIVTSGVSASSKQASVEWAQQAVDRNPTNFNLLTSLALAQRNAGDLSGARRSFNAALRSYPWYAQALSGLASLDLQEGDAQSALTLYRNAFEVSNNKADRYQVDCLTQTIPRHLSTVDLLEVCPSTPPLLAVLGLGRPPRYPATATPGRATYPPTP